MTEHKIDLEKLVEIKTELENKSTCWGPCCNGDEKIRWLYNLVLTFIHPEGAPEEMRLKE